MNPGELYLILKVALVGGLVAADETACGQFMISRPLLAGFLTGLLTGNPLMGCAFGALFELLYIDVLPAGGSRFPSAGFAAVAAVSASAYLGMGSLASTGIFLPALVLLSGLTATASGWLVVRERKINNRFMRSAVRAVEGGDFGSMQRAHLCGLLLSLARGVLTVLLVFVVLVLMRNLIEKVRLLPSPDFGLLAVPFGALGVSMVMQQFLSKRRLLHFVIGGLAAFALLRLSCGGKVNETRKGGELLSRGRLLAVFLRSFTIQASWNYERMLGLGFLFSIFPGLARQHPTKDALVASSMRHLEHFNAHPYMAAYALGSTLRLEEQMREGSLDEESLRKWKKILCTSLGAVGDSLFWKGFRPLCGVLGALLTFLAGWLGPLVYIIIYSALHLYVRLRGLFSSYAKGREALDDLRGALYRRFPAWCEEMICLLAGGLVVILAFGGSSVIPSSGRGEVFLLFTAAFWGLLKVFPPRVLLYAASVAMMIGIALWEIVGGR